MTVKPINEEKLAKNCTVGNLDCFSQDCFALILKKNTDCVSEVLLLRVLTSVLKLFVFVERHSDMFSLH